MSQKFDAKSRLKIEGRDKPIYMNVGISLTVGEDGRMRLFDNRTMQTYYLFERQQRQQAPQAKPDFDDDIPF